VGAEVTCPLDWLKMSVKCPSDAVEAVVAVMGETVSPGSAVEDVGDMKLVSVYAPAGPEGKSAFADLRLAMMNIPTDLTGGRPLRLEWEKVREQDWAEAWKEHYHPLRVGRRFVIKPSWEPWPPVDDPGAAREDDLVIQLDPGMAFGTGTHATTQLMLVCLEDLVQPGIRVLDVGCGSGILSIAAVKLGASEALGVDVDQVAVDVAIENVALEELTDRVTVRRAELADFPEQDCDIIVANITAPVVKELAPEVLRRLRPGGYFLTTGFTERWVPDMSERLAQAGFHVADTRRIGEWSALIARKPDAP